MQPDEAVLAKWSGAAPYWEKYRDVIRQMFAPVTQALAENARIGAGHTVLDIATGPGEPALSVAALVGPQGRVIGIDPIQGMVAAARRAAERGGFANAQFEVAFADNLPLPPDAVDAVISRFGAMFFPSPVDAVREILRVLRPGRRMALAVWGPSEHNPFFESLSRTIDRFVEPPPYEPNNDPFRFAPSGKLRDVLGEAGAVTPSERLLQFAIEASVTVEEFWTLRTEMSDRLRERLAALPAALLAEVKSHALEALGEYSTDGGMSFPSQVLIVSATKGRPA